MALSAVVYASDIARMAQFYAQTFELNRIDGDSQFIELSDGESSVVIHAIPADWTPAGGRAVREDAAVKVSIPVPDIARSIEAAVRLGGRLSAAGWQWHGRDVYSGADPEGNVIQAVAGR